MGCPYLTEVKMSFCAAYPVRKLVPTERVVTESACEDEAYAACPVFREALARRAAGEGPPPAPPETAEAAKEGGRS